MAKCETCGREMLSAEGCVEHNVLLDNGEVIDAPRHDEDGSMFGTGDRCGDCGAEPGGVHHSHCDTAQDPSGTQILIQSVAYWDPESEIDPRKAESEYAYVVVMEPDEDPEHPQPRKVLSVYEAYEDARAYTEEEDFAEFTIVARRIQ